MIPVVNARGNEWPVKKPVLPKTNKYLGSGLYTVAEAALYCRVSTSMMGRWLFGAANGRRVIDPEFGPDDRTVSFLDLVQTLAIREIRQYHKVPLPKFRQAIELAKEKFGLDHPFARDHCTFLYGDELVIQPPDTELYVEASGKHRGQAMLSFVELYLKSLDFNAEGLAHRFRIYRSNHEKPVTVTMDPHVRFGEPLLPSGYTALTICDAVVAEGSIERAAEAYGIPVSEAETAYRFADYLSRQAA